MANEDLRGHPLLDPAFVARGTRDVPFPISDAEFKQLYKEQQDLAPEEQQRIWNYPPDLEAMETVEYWEALGLKPPFPGRTESNFNIFIYFLIQARIFPPGASIKNLSLVFRRQILEVLWEFGGARRI